MQTFLPYPSFKKTAQVLDRQRLGKQRVEASQILDALDHKTTWSNHAVTRLWRGYEQALRIYFNVISREWINRGYKHNMGFLSLDMDEDIVMPFWLGDEELHSRYRAALLFKNPEHYSQFGWTEEPVIDYIYNPVRRVIHQ